MDTNFSQTKAFSKQANNQAWLTALRQSSVSDTDAKNRQKVYSSVMAHFDELKEATKSFSGYAEIPLLSNQYFNATVASYVRSFAGFLSIERAMDQPTALLYFMDLIGVTDNRMVLPNIGKEDLNGIKAKFSLTDALAASKTITTAKKLIPGSVEITFINADGSNRVVIKDDFNGNLLAPAGILEPNAGGESGVNYLTGAIAFTLGDAWTLAAGDKFTVTANEDVAGDPVYGQLASGGSNRFKLDMQNIPVTSTPEMLIAENNLMAIAAMQKAVGTNMQEIIGSKLTELYTKLINTKLVSALTSNYVGNTYTIEMGNYIAKFLDYNSRLDAFQSDLVDIDTGLAEKSVKGVKATAYLVGNNVGNWFRKLRTTGTWVDNTDSTYINDLLGYFNGVPVLRHTDIPANTGYAVHKTSDGQLAPLMRGIYLPLTNTPLVGNYNNPTQMSQGVYYQEANESIVPELVQKFEINEQTA